MKLSWKNTKSYIGYCKFIGRGENGKPRCFYLGRDRAQAELKAAKLVIAFKTLRAAGAAGWTADAIKAALAEPPAVPEAVPAIPVPPPVADLAKADPQPVQAEPSPLIGLMLHAAMDEYIAHETRRAPHQVSYAYVYGVRTRIKRLRDAVPNRSLASVEYDDLAAWVAHFSSRPVSPHTGKQISVVTASDAIKGMRAMFDWFDLSGRWDAPKRFERIFRVRRRSMMSSDERDADTRGVETFTVEELVRVYAMAWTPWHRLFIATGINLAMTQFELSMLKRRHVVGLDTETPYVEKRREKTDIYCRWGYLFPEVAEGLRWVLASHGHAHVFARAGGLPPVRFYKDGRTDTVSSWWARLVKRAGVRPLTFRFLRKTAADMVRKLSDRDTSEAMLAHSNEGVAKFYTNHDWEKLANALKLLRQQLQPMFDLPYERPLIRRRSRKAVADNKDRAA